MTEKDKSLSEEQIGKHKGAIANFFEEGAKEARAVLTKLDGKGLADAAVSKESVEKIASTCLALYKTVMQQQNVHDSLKSAARDDRDWRDDDGPLADLGLSADQWKDDFD